MQIPKSLVRTLYRVVTVSATAIVITACSNGMMGENTSALNAPPAEVPAAPLKMVGTNRDATMSALSLNNQGSVITSKPSEKLMVTASYTYNCAKCTPASNNQILVGLSGRSAQACIYDGGNQGQGTANFELKTPAVPGTYEVRFRSAQATNCQEALQSWWSVDGAPTKSSTVGTITVVKLKS
jgi:hypothetical protein